MSISQIIIDGDENPFYLESSFITDWQIRREYGIGTSEYPIMFMEEEEEVDEMENYVYFDGYMTPTEDQGYYEID